MTNVSHVILVATGEVDTCPRDLKKSNDIYIVRWPIPDKGVRVVPAQFLNWVSGWPTNVTLDQDAYSWAISNLRAREYKQNIRIGTRHHSPEEFP